MPASHSFDEPTPSPTQPSDYTMPDVILHPPDDDLQHDGPRLVFDAAAAHTAAANSATTIESRLGLWQQTISSAAPIFFSSHSSQPASTSQQQQQQQRRRSTHRPRPAAQWDYTPDDPDPFAFEGQKRERAGDEMDVSVEIMKVPRGRTMADITQGRAPPPKNKKGGLKARATMALRGIRGKNGVRKGGVVVKENAAPVAAKDVESVVMATAGEDGGPGLRRAKSAKRLSRPISQFFSFNNAAPVPSPAPAPDEPAVTSPSEPNTSTTTSATSASVSAHDSTTSSTTLHASLDEPRSPTASTKAARRRLSFVKLQSIFAQPSPNPVQPTSPPSRPTSPAYTNDTAPSPDMDDDAPATPIDEELDFSIPSIPSFIVGNGEPEAPKPDFDEDEGMGDVSFEMRLDSLHFENLSFDVDRFDLSC
ncbi:unnamed protein product [Peniophora sp. CBMAI 1063]|nr:unnamed protein product [Peniophora sp. CBMAI 1063]